MGKFAFIEKSVFGRFTVFFRSTADTLIGYLHRIQRRASNPAQVAPEITPETGLHDSTGRQPNRRAALSFSVRCESRRSRLMSGSPGHRRLTEMRDVFSHSFEGKSENHNEILHLRWKFPLEPNSY